MNKLFMFCLFTAIIVMGCSSQKVTFSKAKAEKFPPMENHFTDYWSAMYCGAPQFADSFAVDQEKLIFARGLKEIQNGEVDKAEKTYESLIASKNDTIKGHSLGILMQLYINGNKWKDYFRVGKQSDESDSAAIKRLLFPSFMNSKPEAVEFAAESDTLEIEIHKRSIYVPVAVNGKEYHFLFDTGADFTILSESVAKECGVKSISFQENSVSTSTHIVLSSEASVIDELKIGSMSVLNCPSFILPDDAMRFKFWFYTFTSFDGIIGWNAIKNMDVEIDVVNEKMILRRPGKRENVNRNMFWLGYPIVRAKSADGIDLMFGFDSGAQDSHFGDVLLQKTRPERIDDDSQTYYGLGGKQTEDVKVIPRIDLTFAGYNLHFKKLNSSRSVGEFFALDGVFGFNILKEGKFRIDPTNGVFEMEKHEDQ